MPWEVSPPQPQPSSYAPHSESDLGPSQLITQYHVAGNEAELYHTQVAEPVDPAPRLDDVR
jgi:hypothetical protein